MHHKLFPGVGALSWRRAAKWRWVALKYGGAPRQLVWPMTAPPSSDMKWIVGQYYPLICDYTGTPVQAASHHTRCWSSFRTSGARRKAKKPAWSWKTSIIISLRWPGSSLRADGIRSFVNCDRAAISASGLHE